MVSERHRNGGKQDITRPKDKSEPSGRAGWVLNGPLVSLMIFVHVSSVMEGYALLGYYPRGKIKRHNSKKTVVSVNISLHIFVRWSLMWHVHNTRAHIHTHTHTHREHAVSTRAHSMSEHSARTHTGSTRISISLAWHLNQFVSRL